MACFHPISAQYVTYPFRDVRLSPSARPGEQYQMIQLPCGKCIGCHLEKSRQWAIRCLHEASLYEDNSFLTLTYKDLPPFGSLDKRHLQLFMKRLRKRYPDKNIRFFACGEYGEKLGRPHYHVLLFNHSFEDAVCKTRRGDFPLYESEILTNLWGHGHASFGSVTFESAAYVARYATKKINGDKKSEHYLDKMQEFILMSRRPGIGYDWLMRYLDDVYNHDTVIVRDGVKSKPPRYYDKILSEIDPARFEEIKHNRLVNLKLDDDHLLEERVRTREKVMVINFSKLIRSYEQGVVA